MQAVSNAWDRAQHCTVSEWVEKAWIKSNGFKITFLCLRTTACLDTSGSFSPGMLVFTQSDLTGRSRLIIHCFLTLLVLARKRTMEAGFSNILAGLLVTAMPFKGIGMWLLELYSFLK